MIKEILSRLKNELIFINKINMFISLYEIYTDI